MQDIKQPIGNNLGGVITFNFIDVKNVLSIPTPVNSMIIQPVVLQPGEHWYVGYGTLGTIGYSEPSEFTNAGTLYKRMFVAFAAQDSAINSILFNEMRNGQFLIDYKDSNGLRKLIGSIEEPLFFSANLNTKTNMPELAGHAVGFYGDGTHKAYVYNI